MKLAYVLAGALSVVAGCGGETVDPHADAGSSGVPLRAKLDGAALAYDSASAASQGGFTLVSAGRAAGTQSIELSFPGSAGGSFGCTGGATLEYAANEGTRYAALGSEGACAIEVTAYGEVGEPIEGTFSGTLMRLSGTGPGVLSLTEGAFKVARSADLP